MNWLTPYADWILAGTRILLGFSFAQHGAQKLLGMFGGPRGEMPAAMLYTSGGIEFFGGLLLMVGLFTRYTAFLCSGLMAAAYFIAHAGQGFWPILNRGELAIAYCWIFLFIAAYGPGKLALDGRSTS